MPAPAAHVWLPGQGTVSLEVTRVQRAVEDYDENLRFGRNEDSGQWCVFLVQRGNPPLPILGFNDIPHPDDVLKRLYQADSLRRGEEILDDMNRHNEDLRAAGDQAVKDGVAAAAEGYEWGFRQMGKSRKLVIPMGSRASQQGGWS